MAIWKIIRGGGGCSPPPLAPWAARLCAQRLFIINNRVTYIAL